MRRGWIAAAYVALCFGHAQLAAAAGDWNGQAVAVAVADTFEGADEAAFNGHTHRRNKRK